MDKQIKETKQPVEVVTPERIGAFERFMETMGKYGWFKTLLGALMFVVFSLFIYLAINPSLVFRRYDEYIKMKHQESTEYRMQSMPLIRNYLNQMAMEIGAERTYIIEYHNGKSNPSGMQWQYGDMTFINDNANDVRDEYQNVSLVKYPLFYELYEKAIWVGNVAELSKIDKRLAMRLEINEVVKCGFTVLYGSDLTEIGVLGISYVDSTEVDEECIKRTLRKFATSLSPLLDGTKVKK